MRLLLIVLATLLLQSCFLFGDKDREAREALIEVRGEQAHAAMSGGDYLAAAKLFDEIFLVPCCSKKER